MTNGPVAGDVFMVVGAPEHAALLANMLGAELFVVRPAMSVAEAWLVNGQSVALGDAQAMQLIIGDVPGPQPIVISCATWESPNPMWLERSVLIPLGRTLKALIWVMEPIISPVLIAAGPFLNFCISAGTNVERVDGWRNPTDPDGIERGLRVAAGI